MAFFGDDGSLADLVDGAIGEASMFHTIHGYYAHGVSETTVVAPAGRRERLVPVRNDNTGQVTGWALEPHDLWVAKRSQGASTTSSPACWRPRRGSSTLRS